MFQSTASSSTSPAPRPRFKEPTADSTTPNRPGGGRGMQATGFNNPDHQQGYATSKSSYATGLAHAFLCGCAGWAMHEVDRVQWPLGFGCFSFLFGHSLLGVLRFTHPHVQKSVQTLYRHSQMLASICPIALITAQLSLKIDHSPQIAYLYVAIAVIPTICEILLPERNERALDLVVLGTCASLGYMSLIRDRYWAMGLAVLTAGNHFGHRAVSDSFEISRTNLITYGMVFFTFFAVNALLET